MTQPELTKQQSAVLSWVQKGQSNKQIAKRLNRSESTIKVHIAELLKKYGCRNRLQLALFSLAGKTINLPDQLPNDAEPKPFGWVLRRNKTVLGVSFQQAKPGPNWEPMYTKKGSR
jgi:DNA-binding CsgD family transcriptional regulator